MPINELTKSELFDLYEYRYEKDGEFVHRFSVAASTDNRAKFLHSSKCSTVHVSSLFHLHVVCSEDVDSGPKHALTLHPPL